MDKQKHWREQEQELVNRWNAATDRYREAQAAALLQAAPRDGDGAPAKDCVQAVEAARVELESVRKRVARFKAEFSAGKRY
ncbi:MAG: hypothetical protein A3G26_09590 [Betaproteobacteria bacterium RIFCSPLOWO2_12_FULL_65_110]|nr:MAG: hypothetical protein A3H33_05835 [Betaproteobacteria bacterium RIFCSPLOWO2_02_FULL_65_20]OGA36490.1 MAG: hypothetical protein A3G26_09590 [Betaproteobacteria bacterium RIFCSPLOWO2_12_FULL_65_110]